MYINLDPDSVGIDLPLEDLIPLAARHGYAGNRPAAEPHRRGQGGPLPRADR